MKVVEELTSFGTWIKLDLRSLRREDPGEYTITVRVREVRERSAKKRKKATTSRGE